MTGFPIPLEAVEALRENILHNCSFEGALRAALAAWPIQFSDVDAKGRNVLMLVSPLPQESSDDH